MISFDERDSVKSLKKLKKESTSDKKITSLSSKYGNSFNFNESFSKLDKFRHSDSSRQNKSKNIKF